MLNDTIATVVGCPLLRALISSAKCVDLSCVVAFHCLWSYIASSLTRPNFLSLVHTHYCWSGGLC